MNREDIKENANENLENTESIKETNESLNKAKVIEDNFTPTKVDTESKKSMELFPPFTVEEIEDETPDIKPYIKKEQIQPQNRKQKRMIEKRQRRSQKLLEKRVMNYIRKHPEAIKIELDEDKVKEVEEQSNEI